MNKWMHQALMNAHQAQQHDEIPVGAVMVFQNKIIASSHNTVYQNWDPTGHAEMNVIRQSSHILQTPYLNQCDLYVTLEPCTMCAGAIAWSRIRRLYFGAYDPKGGAIHHGINFFEQLSCHHRPEIISGIMENECGHLLQSYFTLKRSKCDIHSTHKFL